MTVDDVSQNQDQATSLIPSEREKLFKLAEETFESCLVIMKAKNHDYSHSSDPYGNFKASKVLGVHPIIGILMRCMDKFKRIETFVKNGELKVKGESVDDAFEDVINYMILAKGMVHEETSTITG